jgi:shikimate kinase
MVTAGEKPVVLMGFMGSGKSTLGKQLASIMGWSFTDLDRSIENQEKRSIPQIFEQEGEPAFRKLESALLKKNLEKKNCIIAIGGGAPCQPGNIELIREKSVSVYLKVSIPQLVSRLASSATPRPLLKGKSAPEIRIFITELLKAREPYYNQADIILESDEITAGRILLELKKGNP